MNRGDKTLRSSTKVSILLVTLLLLTTFLTAPVLAWEFRYPDEKDQSPTWVGVKADQVINDDLFLAGELVRIDGTVNGDVLVFANTVDVTGTINGDLLVGCNNLNLAGTINDDTRILAQYVRVKGAIKRNLSAAASQFTVDKQAIINGNAAVGSENLNVEGLIQGGLQAAAGTFNLTGKINKNARIYTDNLNILPEASIGGSLYYRGDNKGNISPSAQIGGPITYKFFEQKHPDRETKAKPFLSILLWVLVWFMALMLIWLLWFYLSPKSFIQVERVLKNKPWAAFGWGFVVLILLPMAAILTLITVVGIPIAIGALTLYTAILVVGKVIVGYALVSYLAAKYEITALQKPFAAAAVGTLALMLLKLIPVIGGFITLVVALLALGSVFVAIKDRLSERKATV